MMCLSVCLALAVGLSQSVYVLDNSSVEWCVTPNCTLRPKFDNNAVAEILKDDEMLTRLCQNRDTFVLGYVLICKKLNIDFESPVIWGNNTITSHYGMLKVVIDFSQDYAGKISYPKLEQHFERANRGSSVFSTFPFGVDGNLKNASPISVRRIDCESRELQMAEETRVQVSYSAFWPSLEVSEFGALATTDQKRKIELVAKMFDIDGQGAWIHAHLLMSREHFGINYEVIATTDGFELVVNGLELKVKHQNVAYSGDTPELEIIESLRRFWIAQLLRQKNM